MPQNGPEGLRNRNKAGENEPARGAGSARKPDAPRDVDEDIAGVQGAPSGEEADPEATPPQVLGEPPDKPAPDAGEIEWAGQVVKKPPSPDG